MVVVVVVDATARLPFQNSIISYLIKIQNGFTFPILAYPDLYVGTEATKLTFVCIFPSQSHITCFLLANCVQYVRSFSN